LIAEELLSKIAILSPGTRLRKALDDIISANLGALLFFVDDPQKYEDIIQGGFDIDCPFSPEKLYELAKMDGAIVISDDVTKILFANVHLVPDPTIPTIETGMRHRTAERVARQTGQMVVAISKRRNVISLYYGQYKYVMNDAPLLIARVSQAVDTLEKYRESFDRIIGTIEIDELRTGVSIYDVARAIEKGLLMLKIHEEIFPYVIELGGEGRLINMQLEEVLEDVTDITSLLIMDYSIRDLDVDQAKEIIEKMKQDKEISLMRIIRTLGVDVQSLSQAGEAIYYPRGYRILNHSAKIPLSVSANVVKTFKNLKIISEASIDELQSVDGIGEKRALAIASAIGMLKSRTI
jgi:diadenylate cyclase